MKFYITSFSENNIIDNNIAYMLSFIPKHSSHQLVETVDEADIILFVHTCQFDINYIFQPLNIDNKPIVVLDFVEYGNGSYVTHFIPFCCTTTSLKHPEYSKLISWLRSNVSNIKMYFKREFYKHEKSIPIPIFPIDFVGTMQHFWTDTTTTIEDFINRPRLISFVWGLSSSSRPILHGEMMKRYGGGQLCLDERMLEYSVDPLDIILLYKPWYMRMPCEEIMDIYSKSKISVSLFGGGRKCFRDCEASFNSVMAIQDSEHHYAYPWIHGENCIILPNKIIENGVLQIDETQSIDIMNYYLSNHQELYKIYLAGKKNCLNYRVDNYLTHYFIPKLETLYISFYKQE